jgi:hypothetical protein
MLLSEDDTLSSEERFWFGELLEGRLPHREGPPQGPLLTLTQAAKALGVSDPTFNKMLKALPLNLPKEYLPQELVPGLRRIPPALVWYFTTQRGVEYRPTPRGQNGGRRLAA